MTKKKTSTADSSPKGNTPSKFSGKTKKVIQKKEKSSKFIKEVTVFRNAKDYFSLDDRVKHW